MNKDISFLLACVILAVGIICTVTAPSLKSNKKAIPLSLVGLACIIAGLQMIQ